MWIVKQKIENKTKFILKKAIEAFSCMVKVVCTPVDYTILGQVYAFGLC